MDLEREDAHTIDHEGDVHILLARGWCRHYWVVHQDTGWSNEMDEPRMYHTKIRNQQGSASLERGVFEELPGLLFACDDGLQGGYFRSPLVQVLSIRRGNRRCKSKISAMPDAADDEDVG